MKEVASGRQRTMLVGAAHRVGLVLFLVTLVFFLFSALPADPVRALLGVTATEDAVASLRRELGLDQALYVRFGRYLWGIPQLDLGRSFVTSRPVGPEVMAALRATLAYTGVALIIAVTYSLLITTVFNFAGSHVRRGLRALHSLFTSIPSLVVAVGVGVVLLVTGVASLAGYGAGGRMLAASLALSVYPGCSMAQILIDGIGRLRGAPHVTAMRSFGFSEPRVFFTTLLPGAMLPWLAQLSNVAAGLVAGSVVVEVVFSLPGLGRLVLQSVLRADLPMIQGVVLVTAGSFLVLDWAIEVAYQRLFAGSNA